MIGLLVGFLGGLIGNITITSMFELVKLYQPTSPGYWGTIFIISMAGTVMIIIKMHSILKDAMAE
jgi:hypothetical protein